MDKIKIILADRYNTHDTIQEAKEEWVNSTLFLLGVVSDNISEETPEFLDAYGIKIIDDLSNGDVEIYMNDVLVAKWYAPKLVPKYDENNVIYYEIHLDYDSIELDEFHSPEEENNE